MALAADTVWEVRTTGNVGNSGGFNPARSVNGVDRSNQDAPHVIIDGVTITATVNATTTDLDLVGYVPSSADLGNLVKINGGTMTAGTYEIIAIVAGRWRLDRSGGVAAQTGTGRMGGANTDPALIAALTVSFNKVYVRSGTYTITSATPNVAGGVVSYTGGGQIWEGYQTVRGALGTAPIFLASGINTATMLAVNGNDSAAVNLEVNASSLAAMRGIFLNGRTIGYKLTARNCTNSGMVYSTGSIIIEGLATGCTTAGSGFLSAGAIGPSLFACVARANTVTGFAGPGAFIQCISASNTGAATNGFTIVTGSSYTNCVAYGNGQHGFGNNGVAITAAFINCVAEANVGTGFLVVNVTTNILVACAAALNGTNFNTPTAGNNVVGNYAQITGTSSFFTDPANGDFSLNNSTTGGALLKQTAAPGTFPGIPSTSYQDRGAVQTSGAPGTGGAGGGTVSLGQGTWVNR